MKKKVWIFVFAVFMAAAGTGTAVFAYLTDSDSVRNQVEMAANHIEIQEEFEPLEDPAPGDVITKKPRIANLSNIPVYVRMSAEFSSLAGKQQCEPLKILDSWELMDDGYYYYKKVLEAGERTEPLFEFVQLRADYRKEQLAPFDILVYAESVQAFGFSSPGEAFSSL